MRKTFALAAVMVALATAAGADFTNNITFHFTDYVLIPSSCTNAGETGVSTGVAYIVMAVTNFPYLTEAQAAETGGVSNWKQLCHSIIKRIADRYGDLDTDDRPTKFTSSEQVRSSSTADLKFSHNFETDFVIDTKLVDAE